jgi:hypothetical protein
VPPAEPEHHQRTHAAHHVHHRPDEPAHPRQPEVRLLEARVERGEGGELVRLGSVRLDDVDARQILLHPGGQLTQPLLHAQGPLHQETARAFHVQERQRIHRERRQGQRHVEREHDGQAVEVVDGRVDEVENPGPEQHAHRADVVHEARHQVARPPLLVEAERQLLEMGEQVVAQIVLDVAPDVEDHRA